MSSSPNLWSVADVAQWLEKNDIETQVFLDNSIDGPKLLQMTRRDLDSIGVPLTKQRAVEYKIEQLKESVKIQSIGRGILFNVTGFGPFHGVNNNPTQSLMFALPESIKSQPLKTSANVASISVLETSVSGSIPSLLSIMSNKGTTHTVNLHFGVHGEATTFLLEQCAWNEATFRCTDERGYAPIEKPIHPDITDLSHRYITKLPVEEIKKKLRAQGFAVELSEDPGRFLCNYIYYQSLHHSTPVQSSLFVHVPPFYVIPEETQLKLVRSIIEVISELLSESN